MARQRKRLTDKEWESVRYMCMIHCTGEEIAGVMQMDYDTLNKNCKERYGMAISEYIKRNSTNGKMSLRRMQWKSAENGNIAMQIWLGKQWLGQRENLDMSVAMEDQEREVEALDDYFRRRKQNRTP